MIYIPIISLLLLFFPVFKFCEKIQNEKRKPFLNLKSQSENILHDLESLGENNLDFFDDYITTRKVELKNNGFNCKTKKAEYKHSKNLLILHSKHY